METRPVNFQRDGSSHLLIGWSDGQEFRYAAGKLRAMCPCATCREKETSKTSEGPNLNLPVLSAAEARPLTIEHMRPVGNYAYNISFSDGHDSGIYTFEMLYDLGKEPW
jgi:DUF971 family protein